MKKFLLSTVIAVALAFAGIAGAHSHTRIGVSVGIYGPGYGVAITSQRGYYRGYNRGYYQRGYYGYVAPPAPVYYYPQPQYGVRSYQTVPVYCTNYDNQGYPYSYVCGYRQVEVLVP